MPVEALSFANMLFCRYLFVPLWYGMKRLYCKSSPVHLLSTQCISVLHPGTISFILESSFALISHTPDIVLGPLGTSCAILVLPTASLREYRPEESSSGVRPSSEAMKKSATLRTS